MCGNRMMRLVPPMLSAALLLLAAGPAQCDPLLYQKALSSTGWVVVPRSSGISFGTCWVADHNRRLAVTCNHVVGDAREILVYFPRCKEGRPIVDAASYLRDYSAVTGRVVACDAARDLALLRLSSLPPGVRELPLSDRGSGPGDDVHSIGNCGIHGGLSEGTLWWYTRGSVRQVHRRRVKVGEGVRRVWLVETQAPVNEGDSGGPVVDDAGRLVGVTDSYSSGQRLVSQNIDVREVRAFLKETARHGRRRTIASAPALWGKWKYRAGDKNSPEESLSGEGTFRGNGTFVMSGSARPINGRYASANGMLWLIIDKGLISARPAWANKNRFCLKIGEAEFTFDRSPAKRTWSGKATATTLSRRAGLGHARMQPRKRTTCVLTARGPLPAPVQSRWDCPTK